MPLMTWNEFKQHVDDGLRREGASPDDTIWFIDVSFPMKGRVDVGRDEDGSITVSSY